jgi:hypothetical protein
VVFAVTIVLDMAVTAPHALLNVKRAGVIQRATLHPARATCRECKVGWGACLGDARVVQLLLHAQLVLVDGFQHHWPDTGLCLTSFSSSHDGCCCCARPRQLCVCARAPEYACVVC